MCLCDSSHWDVAGYYQPHLKIMSDQADGVTNERCDSYFLPELLVVIIIIVDTIIIVDS